MIKLKNIKLGNFISMKKTIFILTLFSLWLISGSSVSAFTELNETSIINSTSFDNETISQSDFLKINLNIPASCQLFVNDDLYKNLGEAISFSFPHALTKGSYTAQLYCYYEVGETRYYDISKEYSFEVEGLPTEINFYIVGTDFNVNEKSMYLVTPCIKDTLEFGDLTKDVLSSLNSGTHYFQKLENGFATFELLEGNHEFCLINGQVQYSENGFTQDYNINSVEGLLSLGKFDVDSNITNSYEVSVETFDIYGKANPKAYGQTWSGIIGGIILLILGIGILFAGVHTENGKIVIGGVLLCLSAFGISAIGFLGVLL